MTRTIKIITAIPLDAKNPLGAFPLTIPVNWNIIPISPIIEPPATSPEDKLTPFETLASFSLPDLEVFSINKRTKAPTKMIEVVDIGR